MPGAPITATDDAVVVVDYKVSTAAEATPRSCCGTAELSQAPLLIEQLLGELRAAFKAERDAGHVIDNGQDPVSFGRLNQRVRELLKGYALSNPGDWRRFALFNDLHYVRNLVEANDDFELIVLCWKGGQVSRVHNHSTSHCWLAVLDGEMREVQYQRAQSQPAAAESGGSGSGGDGEKAGDTVYLESTKSTDMKLGDVGYINDHLALHSVGCYMTPEELAQWSVRRGGGSGGGGSGNSTSDGGWRLEGGVTLHLYSPPIRRVKIYEDSSVTERTPGYYSKGGVRV